MVLAPSAKRWSRSINAAARETSRVMAPWSFLPIKYQHTRNASKVDPLLKGKVCIVGAGASGVYLAWMLSFLEIEYDFFEARDDMGGRSSTYNFPDDPECAHN